MKKLVAGGNYRRWRELLEQYLKHCKELGIVPTLEDFNDWIE